MLTEAQWAILVPLLEGCRPRGKTQPHDLKRTIDAILWRHWHDTNLARRPGALRPVVDGGPDLHPLVPPRRLGQLLAASNATFEESGLPVPGIDHDEYAYGGARKKELQGQRVAGAPDRQHAAEPAEAAAVA